MKSYNHFARWALEQPWALTPRMVGIIQGLLGERLAGNIPSPEIIAGRIAEEHDLRAAEARMGAARSGAIAVLPVYGVLMQRADMMSEMSGASSIESLSKQFRALMAEPSVGTIVLDVDSPGGGVYGVAEFAAEVFAARSQKRIVAVANSMAASAAYWVATAAEEVVVSPGAEVGSIGVYMLHEDWSAAYEQAGVKTTLIRYGEHKAEGLSTEPLSDTAREHLQDRVNAYGEMFTAAVAKQRGVSKSVVMRDFGQGMVFGAQDAVRLKMADRVGTLDETLARLAGRSAGSRAASAFAEETPLVEAEEVEVAADEEPVAPAGRTLRDSEVRYRHGRSLTRP